MKVYVVQFSKSKIDGICDSSVYAVYDNEEQARNRCKEENKDNIRSYESYHYYYDEYDLITNEIPKLTEVTQE